MWDFISNPSNQTGIQAGSAIASATATVILAFLTCLYVRLTNHILNETRASRGPNVYVDFEFTSSDVVLIIGNSGLSPAHNIHFTVADSIPWRKDVHPSGFHTLGIIKDGSTYLAPGRVLKYIAGHTDTRNAVDINSHAKFVIDYEDPLKKKQHSEFSINLGQYEEVLFNSFKTPESDIVEAIKGLKGNESFEKEKARICYGKSRNPCPICGEIISASAKKCFHCLEFLKKKEEEK